MQKTLGFIVLACATVLPAHAQRQRRAPAQAPVLRQRRARAAHARAPRSAIRGNVDAAKGKISMCIGCHGIPMYKTAYPEVYSVPMIAGQSPDYIQKALQDIQGRRPQPPEHARHRQEPVRPGHGGRRRLLRQGKQMNRLLTVAIGACISLPAWSAGDAASGQKKSQACAVCHGPDGNSPTGPDFPRLAGQHQDYLFKALKDYKSGARKNPIMAGQVAALKPQDMADLAAFYSSQKGPLHVVR